ncbi:MAG: hypothetical protein AB4042_14865 [Leptolyngbyaceae cyanobacterium]
MMPLTVKGLLLGILGILDVVEWVASPQGWIITNYVTLYWTIVGLGLYEGLSAIALSATMATISALLLFEAED